MTGSILGGEEKMRNRKHIIKKGCEEQLRLFNQSRPRTIMPRPAVIKSGKEYNRQKFKSDIRKCI